MNSKNTTGTLQKQSNSENYVCYDPESPNKKFYVIRRTGTHAGLGTIVSYVLDGILYAIERNLIPVVDLQNQPNQYLTKDVLYKENAWEYYSRQPADYTLTDIYHSQNISLHEDNVKYGLWHNLLVCKSTEWLKCNRPLYKKHIIYNQTTKKYLIDDEVSILQNKDKLLGVLCRGTDYLYKKPKNHARQPNPQDVLRYSEKVMQAKNCQYVFLATEDIDIYKQFKKHFGDRLLTKEQQRFSGQDLQDVQYLSALSFDKKLLGLQYLSVLNLLAKCHCFIGGLTAATPMVYLMTEGFEYEYVFDLGAY